MVYEYCLNQVGVICVIISRPPGQFHAPPKGSSLQKHPHWHFSSDCNAAAQCRGSTSCVDVDSASANIVNTGTKLMSQQEGWG